MPKIITEFERQQTRNAIIEHTRNLIYQRKGINNFTVEDIVRSAKLGKAKFYTYFESKEECLFEVVEHSYIEQLEEFNLIMESDDSLRNKMIRFLKEIYLSEASINNYFSPEDFELVMRKLPSEFIEKEERMSNAVLENAMGRLQLEQVKIESLAMLLDCLTYTASYTAISKEVREETLNTLVNFIADYVDKNAGC